MLILVISVFAIVFVSGLIGAYRGFVKEIFSLAALGSVLLFARPVGLMIEPFLNHRLGLPVVLSSIFSPIAGGFLIFLIVGLLAKLVEKIILVKRGDRIKRTNRIGGAAIGSLKGIVFSLILIIILYNFGVAAETIKIFGLRSGSGLAGNLIDLKDDLDTSIMGSLFEKANPLPQETFGIVDDLIDIAKDPQALERMVQDPAIQELMDNPKLIKLREDEELIRLIKDRNFKELLDNDTIAALLKDKELLNELKNIDIEGIIERANMK